jgi:hypothetical protein
MQNKEITIVYMKNDVEDARIYDNYQVWGVALSVFIIGVFCAIFGFIIFNKVRLLIKQKIIENFKLYKDRTYEYYSKEYVGRLHTNLYGYRYTINKEYNEKGVWELKDNNLILFIVEENGKKTRRIDTSVIFEELKLKKALRKLTYENIEFILKGKKTNF